MKEEDKPVIGHLFHVATIVAKVGLKMDIDSLSIMELRAGKRYFICTYIYWVVELCHGLRAEM